ncbi:type II toxin-antitoxin system VapC family toxin [Microcoleus sp. S13C4]|uniref:type II toxin-antitoxin system VapC family toxin n=1 Tax=Microcoleus sp. S13C4 TaxID=3055410 RepID=UPI002FCEB63C
MKLLLDTHTFIWWDSSPQKLSAKALALCQNPENILLLSIGSIWEMQIKLQLGKLSLNLPLPELIESQQLTNNIEVLPINLTHLFTLDTLPNHHKDPFDRLLISQAIVENAVLVSGDSILANYPVKIEW